VAKTTSTSKPAKTAAKKAVTKAATKPTPKAGTNAATDAIDTAAAAGAKGPTAKADAVKNAQLAASAGPEKLTRCEVAPGHSIMSGGVRYLAGEAIDLPQVDVDRFRGNEILDPDADGQADEEDDGDDGDDTLTGAHGVTVPHPDTPAGAELQKTQEQESAEAEAQRLADGLPSGAENK